MYKINEKNKKSILIYYLLILLIVVLFSNCVLANVFFNQVLYDPIGTESGGEAIQLYNNGSEVVSLTGWVIETESSARDVVFSDSQILPGNYFLIADTNWEVNKDNLSWQKTDLETTITMKNSNSHIQLIDGNNTVVDLLCWGNLSNSNFTNCAEEVESGHSLLRQYYTGNNLEDYTSELAEFFDLQIQSTQRISLSVNVVEDLISIQDVIVDMPDDDSLSPGIQISPNPGNIRVVNLVLSHNVSVLFEGQELKVAFENDTYHSKLNLAYNLIAGNKSFKIKAKTNNESRNIGFEFLSLAAISIDADRLEMNSLELIGDYDFSSRDSPTIKNMGNTQVKIAIKATDFVSGKKTIPVSNLYFKIGQEEKQARRLSDLFSPTIDIGETIPLGILFKTQSLERGNYQGTITIMGVSP